MKIAELLVRVHNLYPHSLKTEEMIDFCNEVGAMLRNKYVEEFETVTLRYGDLLPYGVTKEDIVRCSIDGALISRDDLIESGYITYPDSRRFVKDVPKYEGAVEVTYRKPYEPIRYIDLKGNITNIQGGFNITELADIRVGDILLINKNSFTVTGVEVMGQSLNIFGNEPVMGGTADIERVIDDLTIVNAPYDRIYTEFLLARAARFKKDYEAENRAMENYRALLEDFEGYLVRNGKRPRHQRFFNLW